MPTGNEQAKFSVVLDDQVSDSAENAASAVEALRDQMKGGESALKEMSAAMRRLKGNTDEVKSAKAALTAKIAAQKDSVSALQLALLKEGDAAKKLEERTKALAKQKQDTTDKTKAMGNAVSAAGGPVAALKSKLDTLKGVLGETGGASGVMAFAAAGLLAAVAALTVAVGAGIFAFGRWVAQGANAARTASLMREAFGGSAANGAALGSQIDLLARKVPTAKKELDALAGSLLKSGLEGQTFVDSLNAISQANAALGDDSGSKIRELLERGKVTQRFSIQGTGNGFDELQGTGIQRDDVAAELAKNLKVGLADARKALAEGRVKLGDGAAAVRAAIEKKFGGLNLRKMLDLNVMAEKLRERFDSLTNKVDIEPLLRGFAKLGEIFDENTVTGATLKELVTVMGSGLAKSVELAAPIAKKFIQGLIIGALQATIAFLRLRNWIQKTFGDSDVLKNIDVMKTALIAGEVAVTALAIGIGALAGAIVLGVQGVYAFGKVIFSVGESLFSALKAFTDFQQSIFDIDWAATGTAIVDGIINGIRGGFERAKNTVMELGERIKGAFTGKMEIQSPSKVFERYGENTADGFTQGIENSTSDATQALDAMASKPSASGGTGKGAQSVSISMPITIQVQGGEDAAKQLTDPTFLAQLTKALEDVLIGAGVPVTT